MDVVEEKFQGRLINAFDINTFADAIISYYRAWKSSKPKYCKLRRNIAKFVNSKYSDAAIIPKLKNMLIEN